jgi:hypothetical protein
LNKGVKVLLENKAVITFFSSTHEPDTPHFVFQDKRKNPKDEASKSKSVEDTATTSNDAGKRKREEKREIFNSIHLPSQPMKRWSLKAKHFF